MDRQQIAGLASGKIGVKQEMLWNQAGTWPEDMSDSEQNPHGRPINYWCPTVNGQTVGWEGISGWTTKDKALEIAGKFRQKCIDWLAENDA